MGALVILSTVSGAWAGPKQTTCQWASGPAPNPKLMLQIEIDPEKQAIKETYSNSDGAKFPVIDLASFSVEYENGLKADSPSGPFVDTVVVGGNTITWSREGATLGGWFTDKRFFDKGLEGSTDKGPAPGTDMVHYQRSMSLDTISGEYKQELHRQPAAGQTEDSTVTFKCSAISSTP
jgi:hypothetical protein